MLSVFSCSTTAAVASPLNIENGLPAIYCRIDMELWRTKLELPADSVEFCPNLERDGIFVVGTYKLNEVIMYYSALHGTCDAHGCIL